jgi:predicted  nucleic acid-binding Zn-ribbon protein
MPQSIDTEIRNLIFNLDKKIDALDKKVEVSAARTEERFNRIDQRFASLETQVADLKKQVVDIRSDFKADIADIRVQLRSQDNRLWAFIVALFLAVYGTSPTPIFACTP